MNEDAMPKDFTSAVKDIKLAILQARARAAQLSNVEALKLYFFVGGYISKKTRSAKWGTGAINALSERLQVELPGLRGFSVSGIKRMRLFFERWTEDETIRPIALGGLEMIPIRHLQSDKFDDLLIRHLSSVENRPSAMGDFGKRSAHHLASDKIRPLATDELTNEDIA